MLFADTLAKRMLRPAKWPANSQAQTEAQEASVDPRGWYGPSAVDVFGDSLVVKERNPYRIVGVFARRYWEARRPPFHLDELVCSTIFPCLQHAEPPAGRPQILQIPIEPPRPIKAFQDSRSPRSSRAASPPGDTGRSLLEGAASGEPTSRRDTSQHPEESQSSRMASPRRASWASTEQAVKDREDACCAMHLRRPFSRYFCVVLPGANIPRSSAPVSYPRASVENNNMRIPSLLSEYLQKNCVAVERPAWDRSHPRKPRKVGSLESRRLQSSIQSDDTESSCEEEVKPERNGAFESKKWEMPGGLRNSVASGVPQFLRRKVGNRWLPSFCTEADVCISEYWKLENMKDRDKAAWVYQGLQTEPTPVSWRGFSGAAP